MKKLTLKEVCPTRSLLGALLLQAWCIGLAGLSEAAVARGYRAFSVQHVGRVPAISLTIGKIDMKAGMAAVSMKFGAGKPRVTTAHAEMRGGIYPAFSRASKENGIEYMMMVKAPYHDPARKGAFEGVLHMSPDDASERRMIKGIRAALPGNSRQRMEKARKIVEELSGNVHMIFRSPIKKMSLGRITQ